jgi:leucyl-tRNA synthetase
VLANEQVDATGHSWRSGALVEKRMLKQWYVRITDYADVLDKSLDSLRNWPANVRNMQRSWIGRSGGATVSFDINIESTTSETPRSINVFSTRPDTIFGVTFIAVSPRHAIAEHALESLSSDRKSELLALRALQDKAGFDSSSSEPDGTVGVLLDVQATHPLTGALLPVYAAAFVLDEYGEGAVMGVPGHDARDHAFATVHGLPIKTVVVSNDECDVETGPYTGRGTVTSSHAEVDGLDSDGAQVKVVEMLQKSGKGSPKTAYRLRDWLVSRQRYWGAPIPIIHCDTCGAQPVPEVRVDCVDDVFLLCVVYLH